MQITDEIGGHGLGHLLGWLGWRAEVISHQDDAVLVRNFDEGLQSLVAGNGSTRRPVANGSACAAQPNSDLRASYACFFEAGNCVGLSHGYER